ncbi:MAG: hypothetical protein ACLTE2_08470 [Eubacteriales bacterium]
MNKAVMKTFAIKARKKLIDEILDRIQMFSLDSKTELPNLLPKNPVKQECFLQLQRQIEENDALSVAEQAACVCWFHRLVSIWFMEVNEYLPTEPFFSRFSPNGFKRNDVDADTLEEKEEMQYWKTYGYTEQEAAAQILFMRVCSQLGRIFPQLFSCYAQPVDFLIPKFHVDSVIYEIFISAQRGFCPQSRGTSGDDWLVISSIFIQKEKKRLLLCCRKILKSQKKESLQQHSCLLLIGLYAIW